MTLDLLALLCGGLLTLSFAPFHQFYLAFIVPALLAYSWSKDSNKRAFFRGWLFGLGLFLSGGYWIYISMHDFGGVSLVTGYLMTFIIAAILAIFYAIQASLWQRAFPNNSWLRLLVAFPVIWVLFEWLRGWLFTGLPWLFLGYSQVSTTLGQFAKLGSIYLVSLMTCLCSILLWQTCQGILQRQLKQVTQTLIAVIIIFATGWALANIHWVHYSQNPITVALVQGNIQPSLKWKANQALNSVKTYRRLSESHIGKQQLIFWPESSITLLAQEARPYLAPLAKQATNYHTSILLGIPTYRKGHYYNAAMVIGDGHGFYAKHHLLPFGEYVPLQSWFGQLFEFLSIPMSNFTAGHLPQPLLDMNGIQVALVICYESAFPELVRQQLQNAALIATISDDSWFGHSIGPYQHEQIAQMRAIETGRYIVRTTNSGVTSIIAPSGKVISRLPSFTQGVLTGKVYPATGQTPWSSL